MDLGMVLVKCCEEVFFVTDLLTHLVVLACKTQNQNLQTLFKVTLHLLGCCHVSLQLTDVCLHRGYQVVFDIADRRL